MMFTYLDSSVFKGRFFLLSLVLLLSLKGISLNSFAQNTSSASEDSQSKVSYLVSNPLHRLALYIGRGSKLIGQNDINEMVATLEKTGQAPDRLKKVWNQLLVQSYYLLKIRDNKYYFPVGFELETGHPDIMSSEGYKKGAEELFNLTKKYFGQKGQTKWKLDSDDPSEMKDARGGQWLMTQEWVRDSRYIGTRDADGWETVSPPFFEPDSLRLFGMYLIAHGKSPYGQLGEFTGGHQTFNLIPAGEKADAKLVGLTAANMFLLQAQFTRSLFDVLDVKRFGSYKNFFLRPILFDHQELLETLKNSDPKTLDITQVEKMLFDTYALKEFENHITTAEYYSDEDRAEMRKWSDKKKKSFWKNWKYRDGQLRFNAEKPERTLIEIRINDHVNDNGLTALRATYIYQKMLTLAFDMAKRGEIWQLNVPYRHAGENLDAYWQRLKAHPQSSDEKLFLQTIGLDKNDFRALKRQPGFIYKPSFQAGSRESFGFEMETLSDAIVNLIIPNDPEVSEDWRDWGKQRKLSYLAKKGIELDGSYSPDIYRVLTTEFSVDTQLFPFMDADLHIEESGNLEIKSNGKFVYSLEKLHEQMKVIKSVFGKSYFGAHVHIFVPDSMMQQFRETTRAAKFVSFMERLSFYLQLKDYTDEKSEDKPTHALDSWSLDRYSEKDLVKLYRFLIGTDTLNNIELKYHNIGFRKVQGGVDIELRTAGDDVDFGAKVIERVQQVLRNPESLGEVMFHPSRALFHDFRDVTQNSTQSYHLSEALKAEFPQMTETQKKLAHNLQFEMYRPSMSEYMFYGKDYLNPAVAAPHELTLESSRANFESNVVFPLQNYSQQNYLSETDLQRIAAAKKIYLGKMYALILEIEKSIPKYLTNTFLLNSNYMYLAEYLRRSTAPDRPDFEAYDKKITTREKARQRLVLENIVYKARRIVMDFVVQSNLDQVYAKTVYEPVKNVHLTKNMPATYKKVETKKAWEYKPAALSPMTCQMLF